MLLVKDGSCYHCISTRAINCVGTKQVVILPNSKTFSDWRRMRQVLWVKTH